MESKDLYHIVVKPGIDHAFIAGVIATLDYIYGESTRMTATASWIPLVICFERDGAFDLAGGQNRVRVNPIGFWVVQRVYVLCTCAAFVCAEC
ncbi:hypothetical protein WN944_023130 [Citrus x changshan-huyou]|uniref:Uncharacterized protein n=1 Tax=Citrus x changshan-huyou TaxID=2935761 RepID=A0AAP0MZT8_9ROSI